MSKRTVLNGLVLALGIALLAACDGDEGERGHTDTPPPAAEATSSRCDFPIARPSYLPWDKDGEIPQPDVRSYDEEIDRAQLSWTNPENPRDGVALTVYPLDEGRSPEQPIGVRIRGAPGYLHKGSAGEHSAWWNLDSRCNFLELSVSLSNANPDEVDNEVAKVARSLR